MEAVAPEPEQADRYAIPPAPPAPCIPLSRMDPFQPVDPRITAFKNPLEFSRVFGARDRDTPTRTSLSPPSP